VFYSRSKEQTNKTKSTHHNLELTRILMCCWWDFLFRCEYMLSFLYRVCV